MSDGEYPDTDPRVFFELARDRFAILHSFVDAVDSKLVGAFGLGSALLGIQAALLALKPLDTVPAALLVAVSAVAYVAIAYYSLPALWTKDFPVGPSFEDMWAKAWAGNTNLEWEAATSLYHYCLDVSELKRSKNRALKVTLGAIAVQTLALVAAFGVAAAI